MLLVFETESLNTFYSFVNVYVSADCTNVVNALLR